MIVNASPVSSLAMAMMEEGPSVVLFVVSILAISAAVAIGLPPLFDRLPLKLGVPALALVGPVLAFVGSLIGALSMILSGHDIWYALLVAVCTGAAAIFVGLRLARPVARDLGTVADTVEAVASGERSARTGIDRNDEIGKLALAVDELGRSLGRAETERAAADDERRSVVSALSHDLRTPLAALLVSVDALEDGVGDPDAHVRSMRGNVLALEQLVGDLFLLARADSGSLALSRECLDLSELIDEAVEAVEPMAAVKDVTVDAALDGPIMVAGDHRALGRVLRNLLDNAIRHSPEGGVVHIAETTEHPDTGATARVDVIDEGNGFPKSFVPHAFDRFSQADGARSRTGGAGLGLAIARTLLDAHEGRIEIVDSGAGGHVAIELPVAEREDEAPRAAQEPATSRAGSRSRRHPPPVPARLRPTPD